MHVHTPFFPARQGTGGRTGAVINYECNESLLLSLYFAGPYDTSKGAKVLKLLPGELMCNPLLGSPMCVTTALPAYHQKARMSVGCGCGGIETDHPHISLAPLLFPPSAAGSALFRSQEKGAERDAAGREKEGRKERAYSSFLLLLFASVTEKRGGKESFVRFDGGER